MADFITNLTGTAELDDSEILAFDQSVLIGIGQNNVMDQFASYAQDIGAKSISLTKYPRFATGATTPLAEREAMGITALGDSEILFTPAEYGRAITLTNLSMVQSGGKALRGAVGVVAADAGNTLDRLAVAALNASTNVIFNGTAGTEAGLAAGDVTNGVFLNKMYNKLARASVPMINGAYVAVLHDDQINDLRAESAWVDVQKYANADQALANEVGMYRGFRVVRNNNIVFGDQSGAGTVDAYRGLYFGANALGKVESQPLSTFVQLASDPGQRFWYAGWKATLAYGIVDPDCVYVGVTSSSVGANAA